METSSRKFRPAVYALAVALAASSAGAGSLYKSVDREGRVTFSDLPQQGAVVTQRIEMSESAKAGVAAEGGAPRYLALLDGYDEVVRSANDKLDMAEHALAEARRSILGESDPLTLGHSRRSRAETQQLEFYKKDVLDARRNLLRVLQTRNAFSPRSVG